MTPTNIKPLRLVQREAMHVVGPRQQLDANAVQTIQHLWEQLVPYLGKIPGQTGDADYGVCLRVDGPMTCFDYMAAIEVTHNTNIPTTWSEVYIAAQTYAVFAHTSHVSQLCHTIHNIFDQWLPDSGWQHLAGTNSVHFFERYGETFNPETGVGDIEIWLPVHNI